jgi:hypothetical protein
MNRLLIDEYRPKAVVFTGIDRDLTEAVARAYRLEYVGVKLHDDKQDGKRLVEHYRDNIRPWFFIRHPTGDRGLTKWNIAQTKAYIQSQLVGAGRASAYAPS